MSEWKTMETAPRDGTRIEVVDWGGSRSIAYWEENISGNGYGSKWVLDALFPHKPGLPILWRPMSDGPARALIEETQREISSIAEGYGGSLLIVDGPEYWRRAKWVYLRP